MAPHSTGTASRTCSYNNDTGNTLTFGQSAATNEMCIFGGQYYYPVPDGQEQMIFCLY